MPQAITLGRTSRYVLIYRTDPSAPRVEPMTTTEVRGKKRYGEGTSLRVARSLAVGVGQWTDPPTLSEADRLPAKDLGTEARLINGEEVEELRKRFSEFTQTKLRIGWVPPRWHWRHWQGLVLPYLVKFRLVQVNAFADVHWRRPSWWPMRQDPWRPLRVVDDEDDVA